MKEFEFLREMRESEPRLIGDGTSIPPVAIKEIKHLIRKGAKDLNQKWKDAVHLVKKAYDVAGYTLPKITQKDGWTQYEHLIGFAVRELAKTRGRVGAETTWRTTTPKAFDDDTVISKDKLPLPLGTKFSDFK